MLTLLLPHALTDIPSERSREIAYVIRRYKPGKSPSRNQIEFCRLDGSRTRVLPTTDPPYELRWLDQSTVIWSGRRGIWRSKLSPWHPRLAIAARSKDEVWQTRFVHQADEICHGVREFKVGERAFSWSEGKLNPIPKLTKYDKGRTSEDEVVIRDRLGNPRTLFVPVGADTAVGQAMTGIDYFYGSRVLPKDQGIWILARGGMSTAEDMQGLVWEMPSGKQVVRVKDAYSLDADPRRETVVYASWIHISKLGRLNLFMNQLETCNWKTGVKKVLVAGDVVVTSVAVRPL